MLVFQFSLLFVIFSLSGCECDTYRIGCRKKDDTLIMKKILLSVPTSSPSNHTIIYEYYATKSVSFIEYQVGSVCAELHEKVIAEILFTGAYSLEAKFHIINVTELIITMTVYGYDQFNVPRDFQPILVPQHLIVESNDTPKFGVGFHQPNDELVFFDTKSTRKSDELKNHTIEFTVDTEHFITYANIEVNSKTAGATFIKMTEHTFYGIVYDVNSKVLNAKLYIYGYKMDNLPENYTTNFAMDKNIEHLNWMENNTDSFYHTIELDDSSGSSKAYGQRMPALFLIKKIILILTCLKLFLDSFL